MDAIKLCLSVRVRWMISLVLLVLIAQSAQATEIKYRVGLAVWSGYPTSINGFKDALTEAGLIEGKNLHYLVGEVGADPKLQKRVAEQFRAANADLVYSLTTPGTTIVKEVMPPHIPIVFSIVTYPADSGLIESFEYSGNNLVGTSNYVPLQHYLTLIRLILPDTRKAAIFHRKGEPNSKIQSANLIRLLKRENIKTIDLEASNLDELKSLALEQMDQVDLFITTTDTLMQGGGEQVLIELSLAHGVPILSSNKNGIEQGSTFGPVADFYTLGRMAGSKAAKILLDKVHPRDLESELQTPPLFLVNRKSLSALGIDLSERIAGKIRWVE